MTSEDFAPQRRAMHPSIVSIVIKGRYHSTVTVRGTGVNELGNNRKQPAARLSISTLRPPLVTVPLHVMISCDESALLLLLVQCKLISSGRCRGSKE